MNANRFGESFSIIIPAYNAAGIIGNCLESLLPQTKNIPDAEIIVVDDGSKDDTSSVVKNFGSIRLIRQRNQGPAAARNEGARRANGNIILFTDSDCVPQKDWVAQMMGTFESSPEIIGAKGAYKSKQKKIVARFVQIEYEDKYEVMKRYEYIDFIDTYSAAFKRDTFLHFGGYDTSFPVACAEDVELSYRMSSAGLKMKFNPEAVVFHTHPASFRDYLKKKYKFAYWRMLALKKNPSKMVRDSHTPQIMKIQLLLTPTLLCTLFTSFFWAESLLASAFVVILFFVSSYPFISTAYKKDPIVGIFSPFILAGRSVAQFFGVANGLLNNFFLNKKSNSDCPS